VGRTSYSIMAQGNITQILSSKPEDRRMIFEEAAGITKFKAQKKEALRKLEYTDQNLLRVFRFDSRGKASNWLASATGRQGTALQGAHDGVATPRHAACAASIRRFAAEISERQQITDKLKFEIEACTQSVVRLENEISQLRQRLSENRTGNQPVTAARAGVER